MACLVSSWGEGGGLFGWKRSWCAGWSWNLHGGGDGDSYILGRLQDLWSVSSCLVLDRQTAELKHVAFDRTGVGVQVWCWAREKDGEMMQHSFLKRLDVITSLVQEELLKRLVEQGC